MIANFFDLEPLIRQRIKGTVTGILDVFGARECSDLLNENAAPVMPAVYVISERYSVSGADDARTPANKQQDIEQIWLAIFAISQTTVRYGERIEVGAFCVPPGAESSEKAGPE